MDGVQAANSGHPGMPMGMADVAAVLWGGYLKHNPHNPHWVDRDRFVLSAGHGSMLIYSLLHLSGYDLPIEELKNFRQWGSRTPGHPEVGHTVGVETTTGPLGQGCGNAVGMAIAEAMLAARFNGETKVVDHYTYVIASDGEMMEGASHETFALAGHLGLGKLIVFYDDNQITIEGSTDLAYSDDVRKRFESYHWDVQEIDGHDHGQIAAAIEAAQAEGARPSLIIAKTRIGFGSPNKEGTAESHGAPLGDDEVKLAKQQLGLPPEQKFFVPDAVRAELAERRTELEALETAWNETLRDWQHANPDLAAEWDLYMQSALPSNLEDALPEFEAGSGIATRKSSGMVLQELAKALPNLVGGSADLAPSNNSYIAGGGDIAADNFAARNFHFGVRELGMAAILNGLALHGGFRVFGATFAVFSDFTRPAMRLAALMGLPITYIYTHDSMFVGEDGPTHQPIEHLAAMRCIPNLTVIRPAEATETAVAWLAALENDTGPTALMLTRQNLPTLDRAKYASAQGLRQGAYTLWQSGEGTPELIMIGSGSELSIALEAAHTLADEGLNVRVVSMPSWELFEQQSADYRAAVLPAECRKRLAVEAGCSLGWERYVGPDGLVIGIDHFGASAPCERLAQEFGFTAANVLAKARELIG
jgi:transketolase